MKITDLQNEVNHLLFLYFTSIGVIQRDAGLSDVYDKMEELKREIDDCRKRIIRLVDSEEADVELCSDYREIIAEGKEFVKDGLSFLDKLLRKDYGSGSC
ncbi:hypothetical protein KMI_03g05670 [Encephalitozoon hellem]|uniref:Uncharacterized protein n=1 Tax=Encephalitozoon hellem TaxID=27973 RepID=A0A9Q9CCI5_ENCHE|nr:uncharacterized protein EHEL_061170 [Encephalitozoon hellem ATCC 50504]AFM98488.1 hypothetical protein EHEL_061170 [Encephalitozoon hellem ATCC 50504]KAG5860116.1 hypothetical protein KMI_03g05670 [Encephalitozoon hellem]UTX43414.1 hypothetical protein GPU96_06g11630 [Encephalitozoon hellem]WEL38878.1 hypothetical protein PFJ87_06g01460 [Encephalitozoon hellem]|eukprot:XP_003887469.1 hypothetical protein EHEL_061170 [Encephalitozoon hellem ATCC 50504]